MEMIIGMIKNYDIKQCKYMYSLRIQDFFECFNCMPFSLRKYFFQKTLFRNAIRAPNNLDPDHFGGPNLGSKCLQSRRYHNRAKCYNFN